MAGRIDGQARRRDEGTSVQRFTPRRRRRTWSQRNVGIVERLTAEGRMHLQGLSEVARAKADGRWEVAYAGPATAEIPADLTEALAALLEAQAMFEVIPPARTALPYCTESVPPSGRRREPGGSSSTSKTCWLVATRFTGGAKKRSDRG